jgi:signal transduction histidine kinase
MGHDMMDHSDRVELRSVPRKGLRPASLLLAAILLISTLHYLTDPRHALWHVVYQRLYYVPIIVGAYWYGVRGGLLAAFVTTLAYVPHIAMTWRADAPYEATQYAEIVMFYAAGAFVGLLADAERRLTARYQGAAASLEQANRELTESHAQLARADRLSALGQMAAGLAHELRNPLAGVSGALEIVSSHAQPGTPQAEFAGIAHKELRRLDDLVNRFLAYARPHPPSLRMVDAGQVIGHVVALLGPELERQGISIDVDRGSNWPAVRVDPEQIQQVLLNVLLNAFQASPQGATVRIRGRTEPRFLLIEVADEGSGIAEEHLARVFDPFFTTKQHGTGLGLAVSARIVIAHDGNIDARRNPERGTTISIRLPLSDVGLANGAAPSGRT